MSTTLHGEGAHAVGQAVPGRWAATRVRLGLAPTVGLSAFRVVGSLALAVYFATLRLLPNAGGALPVAHDGGVAVAGSPHGLALAGIACALLVALGIRLRITSLVLFAIAAGVHHRMAPVGDLQDYFAAALAFWLACLGLSGALSSSKGQPIASDTPRKLFVVWFALVLVLALPWDIAFGQRLPSAVIRAITGLMVGTLLWPAKSAPRLASAALLFVLVVGLFSAVAFSLVPVFFTAAGCLAWAPELQRADTPRSAVERTPPWVDASTIVALAFLGLFAAVTTSEHSAASQRSWLILRDFGLDPELRWADSASIDGWRIRVHGATKAASPRDEALHPNWRTALLWTYWSESSWYPTPRRAELRDQLVAEFTARYCRREGDDAVELVIASANERRMVARMPCHEPARKGRLEDVRP